MKYICIIIGWLFLTIAALAQSAGGPSGPGPTQPWIVNGNTISYPGKVFTAPSNTTQSGFNLGVGTVPTSPMNGDLWATSSGIFGYANGTTYEISNPTIAIGAALSGSTVGDGLFVGAGNVLAQFPYGAGVITLLEGSASGTGGLVGTISPNFTFLTGGPTAITASSTNTGFYNQLIVSNSGTSSNSATAAYLQATLGCANCFINTGVIGGSSPTGIINAASGLTGGLTIETVGTLTFSAGAVVGIRTPPALFISLASAYGGF